MTGVRAATHASFVEGCKSGTSEERIGNPGEALLKLLLMMNKVALQHCLGRMVVFDGNFAHVKPDAVAHGRARHMTANQLRKNKTKQKTWTENRLTVPRNPRLQHPEVNSRRPGRFEVRLGASRKKSIIPNQTSLLRQPQVCSPDAKSVLLVFPPFTQMWCSASQPSLCSSRAKVYCLKKHFVTADFFCSFEQIPAFVIRSYTVDVWIHGSGAAKRFSKCAMVVVGSVGKLFHPSSSSRAIQTCKSK